MPPRGVRVPVAQRPLSGSSVISPKLSVSFTTAPSLTWTSIPSRLSQKSIPSWAGSKVVGPVSTLPFVSLSITAVGGVRPPRPTTVAPGTGFPVEMTVTVGETICVTVKLFVFVGRNSDTRPATLTRWPTRTVGAAFVKTNTPSEVSGLASGA